MPRVRPSTRLDYRQQVAVDILPALGRMKVAAVTHADVDAFHHKISARAPTHANRVLACLSKMFSLASVGAGAPTTPARASSAIRRTSARYLSGAELARLTAALAELRDQGAANAVRLLLLTGARRGELLAARWADFDLDAGVWVKPGATTKQKTSIGCRYRRRRVGCSPRCSALRSASDLFPARFTPHRLDIDDAWGVLRKTADIPDVRLHDLRHTYAIVLASSGLSLPIIGALLGPYRPPTTTLAMRICSTIRSRRATERGERNHRRQARRRGRAAQEGRCGMKADIRPRNTPPLMWEALRREHQQVVAALLQRLIKGTQGPGAVLSAQDCKALLAALRPPPKKGRGRPPADWQQQYDIAMCCFARER